MRIAEISAVNKHRCIHGFKHDLDKWSLSDWYTATSGELGEAGNIIKKLNRIRDSIAGNIKVDDSSHIELIKRLRGEFADVFIYLDLMCQSAGISLETAVVDTFNNKSKELGLEGKEFYLSL